MAGCVIAYQGKRGIVYRIKYRDGDSRQVMETLGPPQRAGTTRKRKQSFANGS
jgi:hypothetical protein